MVLDAIIIVLLLAFAGSFPTRGYGFTAWGPYGGQSVIGMLVVIAIIVWLFQNL